ncbi:MAG: hypothetical protein KIT39_18435 [Nitrospirales bacterium]|nr:hypothetical protein [Nitrospirales bacterium]
MEALEDALSTHEVQEIPNTAQGAQFTSFSFTDTLKVRGIIVSMDWQRRWMVNVFIVRLWRSLKYECVYGQTPAEVYTLSHGEARASS